MSREDGVIVVIACASYEQLNTSYIKQPGSERPRLLYLCPLKLRLCFMPTVRTQLMSGYGGLN